MPSQVLGSYPDDLRADNPLDVGHGRMIPTTSWEAMWHACIRWLGVRDSEMELVLPNAPNFGDSLIQEHQLFRGS